MDESRRRSQADEEPEGRPVCVLILTNISSCEYF